MLSMGTEGVPSDDNALMAPLVSHFLSPWKMIG